MPVPASGMVVIVVGSVVATDDDEDEGLSLNNSSSTGTRCLMTSGGGGGAGVPRPNWSHSLEELPGTSPSPLPSSSSSAAASGAMAPDGSSAMELNFDGGEHLVLSNQAETATKTPENSSCCRRRSPARTIASPLLLISIQSNRSTDLNPSGSSRTRRAGRRRRRRSEGGVHGGGEGLDQAVSLPA
ncbi:hypothetical protein BHE74_00054174 [Ensete ventricosum]|nr:hypothetical protein GW17_00018808 [Ensete ventricosum]RWW40416.1 hypothetical protein BHE74_00054174 [Ensete ventricosum]RZS24801.1 hypothetical protein BHM03_00057914 [Ensete ventricosum]